MKKEIQITSLFTVGFLLFILLPFDSNAGLNRLFRIRIEGGDFIEECVDYEADCLDTVIIKPKA